MLNVWLHIQKFADYILGPSIIYAYIWNSNFFFTWFMSYNTSFPPRLCELYLFLLIMYHHRFYSRCPVWIRTIFQFHCVFFFQWFILFSEYISIVSDLTAGCTRNRFIKLRTTQKYVLELWNRIDPRAWHELADVTCLRLYRGYKQNCAGLWRHGMGVKRICTVCVFTQLFLGELDADHIVVYLARSQRQGCFRASRRRVLVVSWPR